MTMHIPKRREDVVTRDTDDESLLYDPGAEKVHVLNATARFVWDQCDGFHTIEEIARKIRREFDVPEEHPVEEDVLQILLNFKKLDLLSTGPVVSSQ